jgi:hypothetical protein
MKFPEFGIGNNQNDNADHKPVFTTSPAPESILSVNVEKANELIEYLEDEGIHRKDKNLILPSDLAEMDTQDNLKSTLPSRICGAYNYLADIDGHQAAINSYNAGTVVYCSMLGVAVEAVNNFRGILFVLVGGRKLCRMRQSFSYMEESLTRQLTNCQHMFVFYLIYS